MAGLDSVRVHDLGDPIQAATSHQTTVPRRKSPATAPTMCCCRHAHRGMTGRRVRGFAIDLTQNSSALGAHEEVERSRPETVALSDRLQPAYQKVLERSPRGGVGSRRRCS
jgi:hypothetical protein